MKKIARAPLNQLILPISLLALAWVHSAEATAPRFSVAKLAGETKPHLVAYEYPPLVNAEKTAPGVLAELVKQALAAVGKELPVQVLPSKTLAQQLADGDGTVVGLLGEARSLTAANRKSLVEEPLVTVSGKYFYYRPAHAADFKPPTDIKGLKGFSYGGTEEEDTAALSKLGVKIQTGEPKLLLRKLQAKEVDFISAYEPAAEWNIAKLFPTEKDQFASLPMVAWETRFSLWFNPSHAGAKEWRQSFAEGMKILVKTGAYQQILNQYRLGPAPVKP